MQHFLYKCCILSFFLFLYKKKEPKLPCIHSNSDSLSYRLSFIKNAVLYFLTRCLGRPFTKSGCSSPMISGLAYFS